MAIGSKKIRAVRPSIRAVDGLVTGVKVAGGKSFGTMGRRAPKMEQDLNVKIPGNGSASPSAMGPQSKMTRTSPDSAPQEARSGAGMEKKQGRVKKLKVT